MSLKKSLPATTDTETYFLQRSQSCPEIDVMDTEIGSLAKKHAWLIARCTESSNNEEGSESTSHTDDLVLDAY